MARIHFVFFLSSVLFTMDQRIGNRFMDLKELKEKIRHMASAEARNKGNPNDSNIDRESAKVVKQRKPEDISKQDTENRGVVKPGNVPTGSFIPSTVETRGIYNLGPPVKPLIHHDPGFSTLPMQEPTLSDYWELFKWRAMLEGAEALRPDLSDAVAAYRHFLEGEGKETISQPGFPTK